MLKTDLTVGKLFCGDDEEARHSVDPSPANLQLMSIVDSDLLCIECTSQ